MTWKRNLWLILPIQIFAAVLFVLSYIAQQMVYAGYELLLFDRMILRHVDSWATVAIAVAEAAMFIVLAIWYRKKGLRHVLCIAMVLICCYVGVISLAFEGWTIEGDIVRYDYDEFESDIVIENWSWLLAGGSDIYETKNGFLLKEVARVGGDDGYQPLASRNGFDVTVTEDGILYEYSNGNVPKRLYLQYKDGHFTEKSSRQ